MKKLFLSSLFLALGMSTSYCDVAIKNTGFYGVYIKNMPFWTFWNRRPALKLMAKKCNENIETIQLFYEWHLPILATTDYEKAQQLVMQLKEFRCDLEIKEMSFSFQTKEEADTWVVTQETKKLIDDIANSSNSL